MKNTTSTDKNQGFAQHDPQTGEYLEETETSADPVFDQRIGLPIITASGIGAAPERAITTKSVVPCCRIYGTIRGVEQVNSKPEDKTSELLWVMQGDFKANVYRDEGVFGYTATRCALPLFQNALLRQFQELCDAALKAAQATGGELDPTMDFDLEFASRPRGNAGYSWLYKNLMPINAAAGFLGDADARKRALAYTQGTGASGFLPGRIRDGGTLQIEHKAAE